MVAALSEVALSAAALSEAEATTAVLTWAAISPHVLQPLTAVRLAVTVHSVAATVHSMAETIAVHSVVETIAVHSEVAVLTAMAEARAVAVASAAEDNRESLENKRSLIWSWFKPDVKFISSSNQPQMRLHPFSLQLQSDLVVLVQFKQLLQTLFKTTLERAFLLWTDQMICLPYQERLNWTYRFNIFDIQRDQERI